MNSNGTFNSLPLWARMIAIIGFPVVVASVLLGMVIGVVPSTLGELKTIEIHHAKAVEVHIETTNTYLKTQTRLLRILCRNTAKTEVQANRCDEE